MLAMAPQQVHELRFMADIQAGGGLIQQHQRGLLHQDTSKLDQLILTPRQLGELSVEQMGQFKLLGQFGHVVA